MLRTLRKPEIERNFLNLKKSSFYANSRKDNIEEILELLTNKISVSGQAMLTAVNR